MNRHHRHPHADRRAAATLVLPVLSGLALTALPARAHAQSAPSASSAAAEDARLSEVEKENAELRRRIDAIALELEALRKSPAAGTDERVAALAAENEELRRRIDLVASEVERVEVGDIVLPIEGSEHGLGPAASKVYQQTEGLSLGGYGELLYEESQGVDGGDRTDALRTVLYLGYKFNERFLFNSEIEFEHAGEQVGVEFAYLDWLMEPELSWRAGLVLVPMGFLNELHEPTTFLSTHRPSIERFLLPSTWREIGIGAFGDVGSFSYRTYVVNGFDASGFSAGGLRGGRQNGSEAIAEDVAWTGRFDYTGTPGLLAGVSAYVGDAGQDLDGPGGSIEATTTLLEAHAEYSWRGWRARALAVQGEVQDAGDLNDALGLTGASSIGSELEGWYAELGYDVVPALDPESRQSLMPFVRYETFDTQADVPGGFTSDPAREVEIVTLGVSYKPIDQVVIKLDYQDVDNDAGTASDLFSVGIGYIF